MSAHKEEGTFTVWAMALCLILFLLAGISVDVWRAFDARRSLTDIADSAARDGASEINVFERQVNGVVVLDPNAAEAQAQKSIQRNAGLRSVDITQSNIDVDVVNDEVNVEIHSTFSFFLLGFLPGASDVDMGARASARPFEG